jgi:hypothetical protein
MRQAAPSCSRMLRRRRLGLVALLLLAVTLFVAAPATARLDARAETACRDFARTIRKVQDGALTDDALREELKAVQANARLSDSKLVRDRATEMLSAVTFGSPADVVPTIRGFMEACEQAGR